MTLPRFLPLITGHKMPSVGLGTFQMKGDQLKEALDFAICIGYRHIDTAASYGNEKAVGQVIHDRVKAGYVKRKELFITSKVPRTHLVGEKRLMVSTLKSLEDLNLSYLNMLLVHSPWACIEEKDDQGNLISRNMPLNILEVWRALESLSKDGVVSNIGVSNFTAEQIRDVLKIQKVPLSNVQLEAHVYYQQNNLRALCDDNRIVVSAYAPLGAPARPSHHVSANVTNSSLLQDPDVSKISIRYKKKTVAQVMLNFLVKCGMVVLPKSSNKERLQENLDCLEWSLSDDDFRTIQGLDKGLKLFEFLYMKGHPDYHEGKEF